MQQNQNQKDSLADTMLSEKSETDTKKNNLKNRTVLLVIIIVIFIIAALIITIILINIEPQKQVKPVFIRLPLQDESTIMKIGTSRVLEVFCFSGNDNRTSDNFQAVNVKNLIWNVDPQGIITVDAYGRVQALALGNATIRVTSKDTQIWHEKKIQVVQHTKMLSKTVNVVNYKGTPKKVYKNYQKIVERYSKEEVKTSKVVPQAIKYVSADPKSAKKKTKITKDYVKWEITNYTDKSNRTYIKRTDSKANDRDKQQYFIGQRYLPGNGLSVISIEDDKENGIWTVEENGNVTCIRMVNISCNKKAQTMVNDTQQYIMRNGMAADASWNGQKWVPAISDNDGLWTSMYAAGELMRYFSLKSSNSSQSEVTRARASALKSLKAVLMISNVAGRDAVVDAKIRRYNSSRQEPFLSKEYLKYEKEFKIKNYPGSPAQGIGFFGQNAGKVIDNIYEGGRQMYNYKPINPEDWTTTQWPATTKRSLKGFIARTFIIPELENRTVSGGLFFKRNENGSQTVIAGADYLYDFNSTDKPVLHLGNIQLPEVLRDLQTIDGRPLKGSDMIYKGDTSSDELIGHMFVYKIAFDILDDSNEQEQQLKELVVETMVNLAQMFVNNGYIMADATGQGTKWTRLNHDFLSSDFTLEDSPLKAIQLLLIFKLTHYMTADSQWQSQYNLLLHHDSYKYADLVSTLWKRWVWRAFEEDDSPHNGRYRIENPKEEVSLMEIVRHIMYEKNNSDDEEALLAYYLIFQLEKDKQLLAKYKAGLNGYWHSICQSQTPLWYFIYQLTQPENSNLTDCFGRNIIDSSAWALSRYPISTVNTAAFVQGSRPDVIFENNLAVNPNKTVGKRKSIKDAFYVNLTKNYEVSSKFDPMNIYEINPLPQDERNIHKYNRATYVSIDSNNKNSWESATVFTLPYWLGVYHKMIEIDP